MKKFKIFVKSFYILLIGFLLINILSWNFYVKYTSNKNLQVGDLAKLSYLKDSFFFRANENVFEKKHIKFNDYNGENIDLIVIGDSFSNGGGSGKNNYYQDYIVNKHHLKVLNLPNLENNYIETIEMLNNSGFLKEKKVKFVLIESVQREVLSRFSGNISWGVKSDINLEKRIVNSKNIYLEKERDIGIINNLNLNAILYNFLYLFDDNAFFSKVYVTALNRDLFSSVNQKRLLFYKDDIEKINQESLKNIKAVNNNLNLLSEKLNKVGVKLYFMPVVDKYNLYSKYIIENDYPQSVFFKEFSKLKKKYIFINTKKLLENRLESGVKDLFYSDDTHWSYKSSEIIVGSMEFE